MKSPLKVAGIDHVVFHVKDLARSKKFYVELLGMEVRRENSWQIFLRCGSQLVGLFKVERGEKIHSGDEVNHLALRLVSGEYQKVKAALEEAGIEASGRRGDPQCIFLVILTATACSF